MAQAFTDSLQHHKYNSWTTYVNNMRNLIVQQAKTKQQRYDTMRTSKNITDEAMASIAI